MRTSQIPCVFLWARLASENSSMCPVVDGFRIRNVDCPVPDLFTSGYNQSNPNCWWFDVQIMSNAYFLLLADSMCVDKVKKNSAWRFSWGSHPFPIDLMFFFEGMVVMCLKLTPRNQVRTSWIIIKHKEESTNLALEDAHIMCCFPSI